MVTKGFYRHYKGGIYFVTGVGVLHDTERRIVSYESTQSVVDGSPRFRYEDEFEEWVYPENGRTAYNHAPGAIPRFRRTDS